MFPLSVAQSTLRGDGSFGTLVFHSSFVTSVSPKNMRCVQQENVGRKKMGVVSFQLNDKRVCCCVFSLMSILGFRSEFKNFWVLIKHGRDG